MSSEWNILLGAGIASIVPIATLIINNFRWEKEKRIEHLRVKHDRLEKIYAEILDALPDAMLNNSYPSSITSKISIYASSDARKVFFDFVRDEEKDEFKKRAAIFDFSIKANEHLLSIEKKIEDVLS